MNRAQAEQLDVRAYVGIALKVGAAVLLVAIAVCGFVTYEYAPVEAEDIAVASRDACVKAQLTRRLEANEWIDRSTLRDTKSLCAREALSFALDDSLRKVIGRQRAAIQ
ncbi:MAG: hypothetical protein LW865_16210 [Betaproteobacteria bacterium]|jgi:hypothetical protein|nr:hypothetical protein [Betaproteobacteria bacterium]